MSVSDPTQLLQRIPELVALIDDDRIRHAISSGDPFKVYRAILWARLLRRLPRQRATLALLTGQRRRFAKPHRGKLPLGSLNAIGFGLVGDAERASDSNTYIALHAFVVLFAIPLIPLGAYIVEHAGASGLSTQWRIHARVPLGLSGRLHSGAIALGLLALTGLGGYHAVHSSRYQELTILNGFTVPVDVRVGELQQTVAANARATLEVPVGALKAEARLTDGAIIDQLEQDIASDPQLAVWNIAGATPLILERVSYAKDTTTAPQAIDDEVHCGRRYSEFAHIDDVFRDPPRSVSMSKYEDTVWRSHLFTAPTTDESGIGLCSWYLLSRDRDAEALPFLEAYALISNWRADRTRGALMAAAALSDAKAVDIAERALRANPEDVDLHRLYQQALEDAGQLPRLRREYAARLQQSPDSGTAHYLHLALFSGREALDQLEQVATRFGDHPKILRSLTYRRAAHGDFAGAARAWRSLQGVSERDADELAAIEVTALVALRQPQQALTVADAAFHNEHAAWRNLNATEFAMVAALTGDDPHKLFTELSKDAKPGTFDMERVRAGLDPETAGDQRSKRVQLALALRDDPERALALAAQASRLDLLALAAEQWALLYAEAVRRDDTKLVARLNQTSHLQRSERETIARYVRGEMDTLDAVDLERQVQAAVLFVRSRSASLRSAERDTLRAQAAQTDVMQCVVTQALRRWPA